MRPSLCIALFLSLVACDDNEVVIDPPEVDGGTIGVTTGDGGIDLPPACSEDPAEGDLLWHETLFKSAQDGPTMSDSLDLANASGYLILVGISAMTPWLADVRFNWQVDGEPFVGSVLFSGYQGTEVPYARCFEINGVLYRIVFTVEFVFVAGNKAEFKVFACTTNTGLCPGE